MKNFMVVTAINVSLSGCTQAENYSGAIASAVPPPASIKAQIVHDARDFLADPYSVRDAEISGMATFSNGGQGVCVKANSKNAMGGYTGRQTMSITIRGGVLVGHTVNDPICKRPDIKWYPFPELESLKNL